MNMTILECTRSMRIHAELSKQFWEDVVNTAMYLINRRPLMYLNCGIPEKAWTEKEVNLNYLRTFSGISYVHVELDRRSMLDPKSKMCIFIGYETSEYGYQFWDPKNRKILRHKDVVFNERKVYKDLPSTPKKDLVMAPWSTPEQQSSVVDSKFVELNVVPVEKSQSILEGNMKSRIEPLTSNRR